MKRSKWKKKHAKWQILKRAYDGASRQSVPRAQKNSLTHMENRWSINETNKKFKTKITMEQHKKMNVAVVAFRCFHLHQKIGILWDQMHVLFQIYAYLWMTPFLPHSFGSLMWIHQFFTECTCIQGHLWNKSSFFFGAAL